MAPRVVGLPLEEALRTLDASGVRVDSVEAAAPPADFRPRRKTQTPETVYVAAEWENEDGSVRLRTVSVPAEPRPDV